MKAAAPLVMKRQLAEVVSGDTGKDAVTGIVGWSPVRGWSIHLPDHPMAGE